MVKPSLSQWPKELISDKDREELSTLTEADLLPSSFRREESDVVVGQLNMSTRRLLTLATKREMELATLNLAKTPLVDAVKEFRDDIEKFARLILELSANKIKFRQMKDACDAYIAMTERRHTLLMSSKVLLNNAHHEIIGVCRKSGNIGDFVAVDSEWYVVRAEFGKSPTRSLSRLFMV